MDGKIAKRSDEITDEMWGNVNPFNRDIRNDEIDESDEAFI